MDHAFQVIVNGEAGNVAGSLELALENIVYSMDQQGLPPLAVDNPLLATSEIKISWYHRVRYAVENGGYESVYIAMHDLYQFPTLDTQVNSFDLIYDFDPSYLVTKFLLDAENSDAPLDELAGALEAEVAKGHLNASKRQPPERLFQRYLDLQGRMYGPKVLETTDSSSPERMAEAIAELPKLARARFEEMAGKALFDRGILPNS